MGAIVTLQERAIAVEPGGEAALAVRVRNTGQVVDQFALQVLGDAAAWASVDRPALSRFPGGGEAVTVRFGPPRTSAVPAGQLPFGIRVVSHEDQAAVVEEATIGVGPFRQTTAELVPRNSHGSRSATHELAVDNNGNVPIDVYLSGSDPDAALGFGFRPPALAIAPGRAGFSRVRVSPRRSFLTGQPRTLPFRVQVAPAGEAAIPVDGAMGQGPIVSRALRNVALGAVALVIAGTLLWFFALRPSIQSTARDAVAQPLAQQSAAIAQLQKDVGAGAGAAKPPGGGGGASPTPSAAGGGGTGGARAGTALARRLDPSGGGPTQYTGPAGATVSPTDPAIPNPAAC